jgi:periplasmic divalent cation tolerance protein
VKAHDESARESENGAVLVLTTTAGDESAAKLSRTLVEEGLAACVTRSDVRSVYRWESRDADDAAKRAQGICEDAEVLLVIKTSRARAEALERRVLELHSYECPELIRIEPTHVDPKYLAWLLAAVE